MFVELYTVAWLLAVSSVIFSTFWLYADLKKRLPPRAALLISAALMVVVCAVVWGIFGLIAILGRSAPALLAAAATFFFSTLLARPISAKLKQKN